MVNVAKRTICSDNVNNRKDTQMYLWLNGKAKDKKKWLKIISIDVNDAIKMTDDTISYKLEGQNYYIIPKNIRDFDVHISNFMRRVFTFTKLISREEYLMFCLSRLAIYKRIYNDNRYICEHFFERYFPYESHKKYGDVWHMFEVYKEVLEREVTPIKVKKGGEFIGCYTDEWGRKRPLTAPIRWVNRYDYADELKVCLKEELKDESK